MINGQKTSFLSVYPYNPAVYRKVLIDSRVCFIIIVSYIHRKASIYEKILLFEAFDTLHRLACSLRRQDSQSKPAFSDSSNPTENVSETAENSADPWSESFEFEDVGNDPNNLWQTLGAGIAFDD